MSKDHKTLDIDTFGEIMDDFITKYKIQLFIELPEGTEDAKIEGNHGLGPVVDFYILLSAIKTAMAAMIRQVGEIEKEKFIDAMLDLLKKELMEAEDGGDHEAN